MTAFYNEIDPYAAQWLRNLIAAGHIAPGVVDERSIQDIAPDELKEFTQCHFFAGVGVWSLALRRAGWPDDRPVWTGSCPCQPFSAAGAGAGFSDLRHLWPDFAWQIDQCRPPIVFGEQVASKVVDTWVDLVHADLEAMGYAFGAVPFPSAGVGAPHIRDRLFWVGHSNYEGLSNCEPEALGRTGRGSEGGAIKQPGVPLDRVANANMPKPEQLTRPWAGSDKAQVAGAHGEPDGCGELHRVEPAGPVNGFWRSADWLGCRDDKWRPVSPKPQPLVDGTSESLGRVRAEVAAALEEEINAWSVEGKVDRDSALRNLLERLGAQAKQCWSTGRLPGLHEAPFLLAFLRQLKEQGWRVAECLPLSCEEVAQGAMRGMRDNEEPASAPCEHGLEGQSAGECTDALSVLSSLLARHASEAWDDAYAAHAEIGFPLAVGSRSRVGRLRGYGNAINAQAAQEFIGAYLDSVSTKE